MMDKGQSPVDILVFPEEDDNSLIAQSVKEDPDVRCPLCSTQFNLSGTEELFTHLKVNHNFAIADVHMISDLKRYLEYWRERFQKVSVEDVCQSVGDGSSKTYILCDRIAEDETLRQKLQGERLNHVLKTQQQEREDQYFSRDCLFCQEHFVGNRAELFDHMAKDHNFNVGLPDNLVFVGEFLTLIRQRMDSLRCLYCEKVFRDKIAIREHMRKKQHRKLNPKNTSYDKFYVINYLEMGKSWQAVQAEYDSATVDSDSDSWNDWSETIGGTAVCLFCSSFSASSMDSLLCHMKTEHKFDLDGIKEEHGLNFYLQVKLINFIRRRIYNKTCISCQEKFTDQESLLKHMSCTNHIRRIPPKDEWDQSQYYFPTYENDNLLCILDDKDEDCNDEYALDISVGTVVYAEETVDIKDSILRDKSVLGSLAIRR